MSDNGDRSPSSSTSSWEEHHHLSDNLGLAGLSDSPSKDGKYPQTNEQGQCNERFKGIVPSSPPFSPPVSSSSNHAAPPPPPGLTLSEDSGSLSAGPSPSASPIPASPTTSVRRSLVHSLFSDATDAWIQGQTSQASDAKVEEDDDDDDDDDEEDDDMEDEEEMKVPKATSAKKKLILPGVVPPPRRSSNNNNNNNKPLMSVNSIDDESVYSGDVYEEEIRNDVPVERPPPKSKKTGGTGTIAATMSNQPPSSVASTLSTASTDMRRGRRSSSTSLSSVSTSSGSFDSSRHMQPSDASSMEFQLDDAELQSSWTVLNKASSSSSSTTTSSSNSASLEGCAVYVRDSTFCWLPATVLEHHVDHALVAVSLSEQDWRASTYVSSDDDDPMNGAAMVHSSMKGIALSEVELIASEVGVSPHLLRKVAYDEYERGELPRQNRLDVGGKRDMADLMELHAAAILYNLKERHYRQHPYTRVGDILVAMNPFEWIDGLYSPTTRDLYSTKLIWEGVTEGEKEGSPALGLTDEANLYDRLGFEPHVYEVSALAYRGLAMTGQNQTILVTGESGAGKTETVKIVMDHLATVQSTRPEGVDNDHSTSNDIVARVVNSSPIFEAFGNAKTVRNSNSSRFGKFIRLKFRVEPKAVAATGGRDVPFADLIGSTVSTYLLEKNRVVFHADGERTFHIFYQLLAAPAEFKAGLWPYFADCYPKDFKYTAGSSDDDMSDAETWDETQQALALFKFRKESLVVVMQALVICFQLGNLVFDCDESVSHEHRTFISSTEQLDRLSEMIGIEVANLHETMTTRTIQTPGQDSIQVQLTPETAKESVDALAKEIYSRIFDLIVGRINEYTMGQESDGKHETSIGHISLLDIFGFENFAVNRFEQLCINYANEKLHSKYVLDNFNKIKNEYIDEGVDLFSYELVDNSEILHLLESRHGLIVILNEECLRPKGNDESFVYKAKKAHKRSNKIIHRNLHRRTEFGIQHFAGPVQYDAVSFVQTNQDKLPDGLMECAAKSTNSLIRHEFEKLVTARDIAGKITKRKSGTNKSVLFKFQAQLRDLLTAMHGNKTRYIRCVKANALMIPKVTHHTTTMKQLECSGLLTAILMSRESFPQKLGYEFILDRYACLMKDGVLQNAEELDTRDKVSHVLGKWLKAMSKKNRDGSRTMPFACGQTKVFFKSGAQDRLELLRRQFYEQSALMIQTLFRKVAAMREVASRREAAYILQAFARMVPVKCRLLRQRSAATLIAAWLRCQSAVTAYQKQRESIVILQSFGRMGTSSLRFSRMKAASVVVQAAVRMTLDRKLLQRKHDAATSIICRWHAFEDRKLFLRSWHAATIIQSIWRGSSARAIQQKCEPVVKTGKSKSNGRPDDTMKAMAPTQPEKTTTMSTQRLEHTKSSPCSIDVVTVESGKVSGDADAQATREKIERQLKEDLELTYKKRIQDLTKANDGLVKEVFKLRHETTRLRKKYQSSTLQLSSKLSLAEEELGQSRTHYERKLERSERKNRLIENQLAEERLTMNQKAALLKQEHSATVTKLRGELSKTQESHQVYLKMLMGTLESTHKMREEETAKIGAEVRAIKKEKDRQILLLQQEVKALRAAKGVGRKNTSALLIDGQTIKEELDARLEESAQRKEEFDVALERLSTLAAASNTLPPVVGRHNMKEVLELQDRSQQMTELLDVVDDLFRQQEDKQAGKFAQSLELVEEYIAIAEPDESVRELRERLEEYQLEVDRLRQELDEKEVCKKCAIRENAARRRMRHNGS